MLTDLEIFHAFTIAAFIAQMAHESAGFIRLEENLNYSAERMAQVWKRFAANPEAPPEKRVPNALARSLARAPAVGGATDREA